MPPVGEYRRSLKLREAEELVDLYVFRPVGFVAARMLSYVPITPNEVTFLSTVASLAAAWDFSHGQMPVAAAWFALANVLDCADGQLARLKNSGTPLGRIVDGVGDYVSGCAVFLGIGLWLVPHGASSWWLVAGAAVSSAVHAIIFDRYQGDYIAAVRVEKNPVDRELERNVGEPSRAAGLRGVVLSMYLRYLGFQRAIHRSLRGRPEASGGKAPAGRIIVRFWSFLGPSTNRTLLMLCALFGKPELYLWLIVVGGNFWLAGCLWRQRRVDAAQSSAPLPVDTEAMHR